MKTKLKKIADKFRKIDLSESNYCMGGGLARSSFASIRHENAMDDQSRLTLGKANQMFAKATGLKVFEVKEILEYAVPNMEWHHAGKLPKAYGGGMKKTYFLNSAEIVKIAENFEDYKKQLELKKEAARIEAEKERKRQKVRLRYLKKMATYIDRVPDIPKYFYETDREMNGKYGWFSSYGKSYNMTEYYSGWKFKSQKALNHFREL